MMWQDLFTAVALLLILEGMLPFVNPNALRNTYRKLTEMNDQTIRITGFISMMIGLLVLYWVR